MDTTRNPPKIPKYRYLISKTLVVGLVVLILLIVMASFSVIWYEGRPRLTSLSLDSQKKLGQSISLALEREMQEVKGITKSLAASVAAMPPERRAELTQLFAPQLFNVDGLAEIIAGGGVWPEPNEFKNGVARNSLFWAKNTAGVLEEIDDYNAPHGPGYRREEWYVPAQVFGSSDVYWSRSYTDPYSQQPMVTCTAPILHDEKFIGVSTVDLKLEGVTTLLNQLIAGFEAYAFVVDRNNRFIVFPTLGFDVSRARVRSSENGFEYLQDLAKVYPTFEKISDRLSELDDELYQDLLSQKPEYFALIDRLVEGSYQIQEAEARRLVSHHWWNEKTLSSYPKPLDTFSVKDDLLLRGDATGFIFQMPSTDWRIVTVFEQSAFGSVTDFVVRKLFGAILLSAMMFGVAAFLLLKFGVIRRITTMVGLLSAAVNDQGEKTVKLDYRRKDELGMLAYWFNRRSQQLESAINSAKRATKTKSDFMAGLSHELRTPLNSIIGFNRRLIVKLGGDLEEENYKTLIAIQRSAHHLLSLIDDIVEVSDLESGKVKMKYEWDSVNMLLDDASSQMMGQIADKGLVFEVIPLDKDERLYADRQKIIQVLLHLLANALEATYEGSISIRAEASKLANQKAIAFTVVDTGTGISEEAKHSIYRQFTQVEEHFGLEKGVGLGLYLIREITALHQGAVFFDSTVHKGSTFKVVIPVSTHLEATSSL